MEFLNKLANAVVTNPLIKDFEILNVVTQAGPWVIHNAIKRSTKERVSVFVLSKKMFDKMSKSNKEFILEKYRNGVKLLTKVRHPKFLTIQHPLEESRESLAFATEPCTNALSNLIKCSSITDVEIRYGILQLLDGIAFLHNDMKRCHRNICLDTVVINSQGLWKIFGLEFSSVSEDSSEPPGPEFMFYDNEPGFSQPNISYIAPELLSKKFGGAAADMYSVGCLLYALFNRGTDLRKGNFLRDALKRSEDIAQMPSTSLGNVPTEAASDIKQLVSIAPAARQQIGTFQSSSFLSDIGAVSLQFLDHLMLKNRNQKIAFFKELPGILPRLPIVVRKKRVLTQLFECCKEIDLVPFILPSIFHIGTDLDNKDFQDLIFPGLKPLLSITDPPQISLIIIQNLHLMISKSNLEDAKLLILPVLFKGLENPLVELQETVLKLLPEIVDLMDYSTLRHQLLPKIKSCCLETRLLKIRVGSLICVAKVLDSNLVDRTLTNDIILPLLEQVPSREPAVLMSIMGIYQKLLKHKSNLLEKDTLATRCVPILFPMLVSPSLNVQQFGTCMSIIKGMITKVENEQLGKLKQMQQNKEEQEQSLNFSKEVAENRQVGELVSKMDQMFGSSNSSQQMKSIVSDSPKPASTSPSFTNTLSSSIPAVKKTTNYDTLAPEVMRPSRESSMSSNTSGFDLGMIKSISTNSSQSASSIQATPISQPKKTNTFADFPNLSLGSNQASSNSRTMPSTTNQQVMGTGFSSPNISMGSQAQGMNSGFGNGFQSSNFGSSPLFNSGMSTNSSTPISSGNSMNSSLTALPMNTGFSNMSAFSQQPNMNSAFGGNASALAFSGQTSVTSNNIQGNASNSLDNLFGPKPSQPSLNQIGKSPVAPNTAKVSQPGSLPPANQGNIDLNDIFG